MSKHTLVGFGFGPIQSCLFVKEAFESGNFQRIVIAEVDQTLVDALRANGNRYSVNIAHKDGIETLQIENVELFNPTVPEDLAELQAALKDATEIVTSLPSVDFYDRGNCNTVADLIAAGLTESSAAATLVYTAENNIHAAETLRQLVNDKCVTTNEDKVQFLNTVIGKMSRVVTDANEVEELKIARMAPGIDRAFLVEAFNNILTDRCQIPGCTPGITVFAQKEDLQPFEEAKLYGHNAIHALLAYLGAMHGFTNMTEHANCAQTMKIARDAFIDESGAALCRKYANLGDPLFTTDGYRAYAEDLLERITNPYLVDTIDRAGRDPVRKLGADDRIVGTMSLALDYNIEPVNMAAGAMAGLDLILQQADSLQLPQELRAASWKELNRDKVQALFAWIWSGTQPAHADRIIEIICAAQRLRGG